MAVEPADAAAAKNPAIRSIHPGDLLAALLLIGWALFLLQRIHYGIDFTDEGMYLSDTDRLVKGDVIFRDSQENTVRQFDLVMSWLWGPVGGFSMLGARTVGVGMQLAQMAILWLVVRRWSGPWIAAVAAMMLPRTPLMMMFAPGYNDLACTFSVFFAAFLGLCGSPRRMGEAPAEPETADVRRAVACGAAAGLALALDALVYLPTAALVGVPVAMIAWGRWRGSWRHPWVLGGMAALGAAAMAMAAYAIWLCASGLAGFWYAGSHATMDQQNTAFPLRMRVRVSLGLLLAFFIHLPVTVAMLEVMRRLALRQDARGSGLAAAGIIGAGLLAALAFNLYVGPALTSAQLHSLVAVYGTTAMAWKYQIIYTQFVVGLACAVVFVLPAGLRDAWRGRTGGMAGMSLILLIILAYGLIAGLASTIACYSGLCIRTAVEAIGAAGVGVFLLKLDPAPARWSGIAAAGCQAVLAGLSGLAAWNLVYHDLTPDQLTATFTRAPLTGIHSTPERVDAIEALKTWVDAHEAPSARMLAYHDVPLLYFALQRRPILSCAWSTPYWPWNDIRASNVLFHGVIMQMENAKVMPDFCVRNLDDNYQPCPVAFRLNDPIHAYVIARFRPAWRYWPFEVMVPRDPGVPVEEPPVIVDAMQPDADDADQRPARFTPYSGPADRLADHTVVLNMEPDRTEQPLATLTQTGSDEVSLRLCINGPDPDYEVQIFDHGNAFRTPGGSDGDCHGWDIVFPASDTAYTRGFVILRRAGSTTSRFVFTRLALEQWH